MPYSRLERLATRLRTDLEMVHDGHGKELKPSLGTLLDLLITAEVPPLLETLVRRSKLHGFKTHLRSLERHLQEDSHLPECLCARYKYKVSETKARRRFRIGDRDWRYIHALAQDLGRDLDLLIPFIQYEFFHWHDVLEQDLVTLEVILDPRALDDLLVCALEGYLSPKLNRRKGYEVYGLCLGMVRDEYTRARRNGIAITRYVSVMRCQPQLSAEGTAKYVLPNDRSVKAIVDATGALFPQHRVVGDFHSHPYVDLAEMRQRKGWRYSVADQEHNEEMSQVLKSMGHPPTVGLIVAVTRCRQRIERSHYRKEKNTIQLSAGDCRVVLGAFHTLESGRYSHRNVRLRVPGMLD